MVQQWSIYGPGLIQNRPISAARAEAISVPGALGRLLWPLFSEFVTARRWHLTCFLVESRLAAFISGEGLPLDRTLLFGTASSGAVISVFLLPQSVLLGGLAGIGSF